MRQCFIVGTPGFAQTWAAHASQAGLNVSFSEPDQAPFSTHPTDKILILDMALSEAVRTAETTLQAGGVVFCPISGRLTVEDMITLRRAEVSSKQARLCFGLTLQSADIVRRAASVRQQYEFGQLRNIRVTYATKPLAAQAPLLLNQGLTVLDLLQSISGPFQDVVSLLDHDFWATGSQEHDLMSLLKTFDGTLINLHLSATANRPIFRVECLYDQGYIWLDGAKEADDMLLPTVLVYRTAQVADETIETFEREHLSLKALKTFHETLERGDHIRHGSSADMFDAVNTAHRIYAADRTVELMPAAE